jgi:hypothetical protein
LVYPPIHCSTKLLRLQKSHDIAPEFDPLQCQIYSTSVGVTVDLPSERTVYYAFHSIIFAALERGFEVFSKLFCEIVGEVIGKNSIIGANDNAFLCYVHFEDLGHTSTSHLAIKINVDYATANPLFLKRPNSYVGVRALLWYYYS